jgi:hypothetical protein
MTLLPSLSTALRPLALALLGTVSLSALCTAPAAAVVITLGGTPYDVSVSETSHNLSTSVFQAPPLGQMPWWGDGQLASDAATRVFNQLGPSWDTDHGPVFA